MTFSIWVGFAAVGCGGIGSSVNMPSSSTASEGPSAVNPPDTNLPETNPPAPVPGASYSVPANCAVPAAVSNSRTFYLDPAGNNANAGSAAAPWGSLQSVIAAGYFTNGKILAGDTLRLRTGNHGAVNLSKANSDFITIAADDGQTPSFTSIVVRGSKYVLSGLTVQALSSTLVDLSSSNNVIFERGHLLSQADVSAWSQADWRNKVSSGLAVGMCSTVFGNKIEKVGFGISIGYDNVMIDSNTLDYLGDDGMQLTSNNVTIRRNRITNMLDIGDGNHSDMIQAFNLSNNVAHDILIEANVGINQTDPNLKFPQGDAQGITEFDGQWNNFRIINNVVVTNHWHAIALYGATNGQVINNTVFGSDPSRVPWIGTFDSKTGAHPVNNVMRNNLSGTYSIADGTVADHNVTASDPSKQVKVFDRAHFNYDLRLLANASAVGAGSATLAPATDVTGFTRTAPIDAGAYEAENQN